MQIPDNAKLVFESKYFRHYTWKQEMFDGTLKDYEVVKNIGFVLIFAITKDGKLIGQRNIQPGYTSWQNSVPSGRLEAFNEDPLERGKIELVEETGYISDNWRILEKISPEGMYTFDSYVLLAKGCENKEKPIEDSGEKTETVLLDFYEFIDFQLDENSKSMVLKPYFLKMKYDPEYKRHFEDMLFHK